MRPTLPSSRPPGAPEEAPEAPGGGGGREAGVVLFTTSLTWVEIKIRIQIKIKIIRNTPSHNQQILNVMF